MTSVQQPTPSDRYGRTGTTPARGIGRWGRVAIGVALAAAVGLTAWFAFAQNTSDPVSHDMVGFTVVSPEQVDVTFQVHMPPGTTAVCTLDALATSYAQVGTLDVTVGPVETRTTAYEVTLSTSEEATSAIVSGCEAVAR